MDVQIINWEMSIETEPPSVSEEKIATGPAEPYCLDVNSINWN